MDRLQTRWNALTSGIVIGIVWSLWHLPLFFMIGTSQNELNMPFIGFMLGITSLSVQYAWLHNNAKGSIWMAVFFHWVFTYTAQVVATGVNRTPMYNMLEYTPHLFLTLLIVWIWRKDLLKFPVSFENK